MVTQRKPLGLVDPATAIHTRHERFYNAPLGEVEQTWLKCVVSGAKKYMWKKNGGDDDDDDAACGRLWQTFAGR